MVHPIGVLVGVEVLQPEDLFAGLHATVGQKRVLVLFFHREVDILLELRNDLVSRRVFVGRFFRRSGNDQGRTGFVDQDGVDFVHDGEVQVALHAFVRFARHVVAQVIESEFVVGAVGDVGAVAHATLGLGLFVDNQSNGESQEPVDAPHPLGVALGQVVVDRHHVHALGFQGVEVHGGGGHQGLAFAGLHFGDLAPVQDHAAAHLHIENPHTEGRQRFRIQLAHPGVEARGKMQADHILAGLQLFASAHHIRTIGGGKQIQIEPVLGVQQIQDAQSAVGGFAHDSEGFRQKLVESFLARRQPLAEFDRFLR